MRYAVAFNHRESIMMNYDKNRELPVDFVLPAIPQLQSAHFDLAFFESS